MGMDVYGKKPLNKTGEYFRNNAWWWRPLWAYCCEAHPVALRVKYAQTNDGDGLAEGGAIKLADALDDLLASGAVSKRERDYKSAQDAIPDEECDLCHGTGTRTDMTVANSCNKCLGKGKVRPYDTMYPFSEENVRNFSVFLRNCGGFEIH